MNHPPAAKLWTRVILRVRVYAATAYVTSGAFLYIRQRAILFPTPREWPAANPNQCGLEFEDLRIPVNSAEYLHAWWIPSATHSAKAILVLHGNGYVLEDMVGEELTALHNTGPNVLIIDYRGYGLSSPIEPSGTTIVEDARAALAYLFHRRNLPSRNVLLLGRSIGSGPATQVATEIDGLGGLILESPFTSIDAVATARLRILKLDPLRLLLRTHFDNVSEIRSVGSPVLIIAGATDTLTPLGMAKTLYAYARPPKQLYLVPRADHDDLVILGGNSLTSVLREFVQTTG